MKTTIKMSKVNILTLPDGGARLLLQTGDGKGDVELELSAAAWKQMGADARWHAAQDGAAPVETAPAYRPELAGLDLFASLLGLHERVKKLEEKKK